jgi:hypothetical protein
MTGGFSPISSSWRQAPWDPRPNSCGNSPYVTSSLTRRWISLLFICLAFHQPYATRLENTAWKSSSLRICGNCVFKIRCRGCVPKPVVLQWVIPCLAPLFRLLGVMSQYLKLSFETLSTRRIFKIYTGRQAWIVTMPSNVCTFATDLSSSVQGTGNLHVRLQLSICSLDFKSSSSACLAAIFLTRVYNISIEKIQRTAS